MNINKPFILFVILSSILGVVVSIPLFIIKPRNSPLAEKGVMDLRDYDFMSDGLVRLFGEWAFYWNHAVSEETYDSIIGRAPDLYASVPSYWDELGRIDSRIKPRGVATYSLKIIKHLEDESDKFAIKIHNVTPNADIYVDGRRISEIGNVDPSSEKSVSSNKTVLMPVETSSDSITIAIGISNYHNANGGLNRSICFGLYEDLLAHREKFLAIDSVFLGGLLLVTLYQFSVLLLSRKRTAPLYLGLLALLSFLFAGLKSEMALLTIFPRWGGEIRSKIIFFAFSLAGPLFTLYCSNLHPGYFYPKLKRIVLPIASVMATAVVFTPMEVHSQFEFPLRLITAGFIVYTISILIWALYKTKNSLIMLSLFGVEFLIFSIILGVVDNRTQTVFQTIAGAFFVFGVYQTVLEAKIFSNALVRIDELSTERKKLERQNVDFFTQVFIDKKTGMYNKALLKNFLQSKWTVDELDNRHSVSMILADVDYFEFYKKAYGHERSEDVIAQLGQIVFRGITDINRNVSVRYGKDAFAVISTDIDEFSLYRGADNLRILVESKSIEHEFAGNSKILTISVGCAIITPSRKNNPGTLIDLATRALRLAKRNGRNRTEIITA